MVLTPFRGAINRLAAESNAVGRRCLEEMQHLRDEWRELRHYPVETSTELFNDSRRFMTPFLPISAMCAEESCQRTPTGFLSSGYCSTDIMGSATAAKRSSLAPSTSCTARRGFRIRTKLLRAACDSLKSKSCPPGRSGCGIARPIWKRRATTAMAVRYFGWRCLCFARLEDARPPICPLRACWPSCWVRRRECRRKEPNKRPDGWIE